MYEILVMRIRSTLNKCDADPQCGLNFFFNWFIFTGSNRICQIREGKCKRVLAGEYKRRKHWPEGISNKQKIENENMITFVPLYVVNRHLGFSVESVTYILLGWYFISLTWISKLFLVWNVSGLKFFHLRSALFKNHNWACIKLNSRQIGKNST